MFKKLYLAVLGMVAALVSGLAQAQFVAPTFDTANAVTTIEAGLTPAGAIGVAALVLVAAIGIWMKLRRPAR